MTAPHAPAARGGVSHAAASAVGVAAAAMVATLPGRTHGLGLVTEPLLADLALGKLPFAALNFWATLIGAAFCVPVGWALDRAGPRAVLAVTLAALGATVLAMTGTAPGARTIELPAPEVILGRVEWFAVPLDLFVLVLLTRGLGQSALSVVSLAIVGKATGDKPGVAIGVYSFLVAVGFMAAFGAIKIAFERFHADWRTVWAGIGWALVGFALLALVIVPRATAPAVSAQPAAPQWGFTLGAALLTPAFWVFGLATSFYGLVAAGMSLFNQSLLAERGFDRDVFLTITMLAPMVGLAANLAAGFAATRVRLGVLLAGSLLIQAVALAAFPAVTTLAQVYAYAAAMGVSGGVLTVVFFTVWRQAFGPAHLGQIQGAAQLLTVLASAAGPLVLAAGHRAYGSYSPVVQGLAAVAVGFVLAALAVPVPRAAVSQPEGNE